MKDDEHKTSHIEYYRHHDDEARRGGLDSRLYRRDELFPVNHKLGYYNYLFLICVMHNAYAHTLKKVFYNVRLKLKVICDRFFIAHEFYLISVVQGFVGSTFK